MFFRAAGRRKRLPHIALLGWFLLIAALFGCQKKVTGPPPRYIFLRFENLSGDPSLDWVGRAASEFLSRSLAGAMDGPVLGTGALTRISGSLGPRPPVAPGISTERAEAILAGGTRLVSGYLERAPDGLRITATDEDLTTGKSVQIVSALDSAPLTAISRLAHQFSPSARPYVTSNSEALRLYIIGLEGSSAEGLSLLERAIQLDSNFGPAWLLLVNLNLARGDRDAAQALILKARQQKLAPLDLANLELDEAGLRSDQKERVSALRKISALSPGDMVLLGSLAETEAASGQFEAAAGDWNKLAAVLPNDPNAWNQLGYARAWAGDYPGALAALKEYARVRPNDPNPLDSMGDIHYMYRKFPEAAASYLAANAKSPAFQTGGDLYKAAWAKFEAGDKAGADGIFDQFLAAREKAKGTDGLLLHADWLYRTGRHKQGIALLPKDSTVQAYAAQLVVWDLLEGDRAAAARDAGALGKPASPASLFARFAAMPSASPAEWEARAEHMIAGPSAARLRLLAMGYALLLDGKKQAARPVWEQIVATTSGTDFFARAIYAKLKGEQPKRAIVPDPISSNPFAAIPDAL